MQDSFSSMKTVVMTATEQQISSGICSVCGGKLIADPNRKGINICTQCRAIQKSRNTDLTPGNCIRNYKILKKLSEGGMGVLFLCCPVNDLSVRYVLKTIRLEIGSNTEAYAKRFKREAQLLSKLHHENIVKIYDFWSDSENAYILMEYIEGETLESIRRKNIYDFDEETAIQIMTVLAEALNYAWEEIKLLHRDIKPSNIMLDAQSHLHILDFGIAKSLDAEETSVLTVAGQGLGTPGYMSPEQFRNTTRPDCTTDIYSLGATIYFLLTGNPPFQGKSAMEVFNEMLTRDPVPLHKAVPNISEEFSQLIQETMNRNPKKRPSNWKVLLEKLAALASRETPLS